MKQAQEAHAHGGLDELFEFRHTPLRRLWIAIGITLAGMVVEIAGGLISGSLALLSDAGHMFTHLFALGISAVALRLTQSARCHHRTFGLLRAEVLAAYTNALFLFVVTAAIGYESIARLLHAENILFREMLSVAVIGLVVNLVSIALLHGHGNNISIRSALTHMLADTLSSVVIIIGAVVMTFTGWWWIDAALSFGIASVILVWAWRLFVDTSHILLEVAPQHVNTEDVVRYLEETFPDMLIPDRIRIWSITEGMTSLTAELKLKRPHSAAETDTIRVGVGSALRHRFGFAETTLELAQPT